MAGEALLEAVRSRGSDARDVRDAAHEACHALQWGVEQWDRESIHACKPEIRGEAVQNEIMARAVEQVVCKRLGVETWSVEKAAHVCWMEMLKNERIQLPVGNWLRDCIEHAMTSRAVTEMADRILALEPLKKAKPKKRRGRR